MFSITKRTLQAGALLLGGSSFFSLPSSAQLSQICIIKNFTYSSEQHFIQKPLMMDVWGSQLCSKALILVICHFKPQSALSCKWFPCRGFPLQIKAKNISVTPPVILQNLNLFHRARVPALHREFPLSYNTLQF